MAIDIITGFYSSSRELLDKRSGPYASTSAALTALGTNDRAMGMPYYIIADGTQDMAGNYITGTVQTYYFTGGITDDDFTEFTTGGGSSFDQDLNTDDSVEFADLELTGDLVISNGTNNVTIQDGSLSSDITVTLPSSTGTLALTSEIPSGNFVYYDTDNDWSVAQTFAADTNVDLSGTVTITNTSTAVVGSGTSFTTDLKYGDAITIGGETTWVTAITDDTNITVNDAFTQSLTGQTATINGDLITVSDGYGTNKLVLSKSGDLSLNGSLNLKTSTPSIEMGFDVESTGYASASIGVYSTNSGNYSLVVGYASSNNQNGSFVFGSNSNTYGIGSSVLGENSDANNAFTHIHGTGLNANHQGGVVLGQANTTQSAVSANDSSVQVLTIGNGTINTSTGAATSQSDALIVYLSGAIEAPSLTTSLIDSTGSKSLTTKEYVDNQIGSSTGDWASYTGDWSSGDGVLVIGDIGDDSNSTTIEIDDANEVINLSHDLTVNGGISLPDAQEIRIGNGDDLRIYHDGTNSYVQEVGTGSFFLRAGDNNILELGQQDITIRGELKTVGDLSLQLTGTVTVSPGSSSVVGSGTSFTTELVDGDAIQIGDEIFLVNSIADDTNLTLDSNHVAGATNEDYYTDNDLVRFMNGDEVVQVLLNKSGHVTMNRAFVQNQAVANNELVRLDQVTSLIGGLNWQESVLDQIDFTSAEPTSPSIGDRYINTTSGTSNETSQSVVANDIYEWTGSEWDDQAPSEGWTVWDQADDQNYTYNGSAWVEFGSTVSHNNTTGLQGGTTGEYYHLTATEHSNLTSITTNQITYLNTSQTISGNKTFTGVNSFTTNDLTLDDISLVFDNGSFQAALTKGTLSGNVTITLPSSTGTLALTSDIPDSTDTSDYILASGDRASGDLDVIFGDFDDSGNSTTIQIDDENSTIVLTADTEIDLAGDVSISGGDLILESGNGLVFSNSANDGTSTFSSSALSSSGAYTLTLPDKSGTLAITADIPTGSFAYTDSGNNFSQNQTLTNVNLIFNDGTHTATITGGTLGSNIILTLPTSTGTFALTSDISTAIANSLAADESVSGEWTFSEDVIFDSSSDLIFGDGTYTTTISQGSLSASNTLTLPTGSGTIALTTDIATNVAQTDAANDFEENQTLSSSDLIFDNGTNSATITNGTLSSDVTITLPNSTSTLATEDQFEFIQNPTVVNNTTYSSITPTISYTDEIDIISEIEDGENSGNEYRLTNLPTPTGNGYRIIHTLFYEGANDILYKIFDVDGTWIYVNKNESGINPNSTGITFAGGSSATDVNIFDVIIQVVEVHGNIYCTVEYSSTT